MYNENSRISIKNVIIQFLFVALFIFLLIWLFPLKSDIKNLNPANGDGDNSALSVLVDRIFNENIIAMKDAAKSYYTTPRLPKNVGDKVKMTLGEMLDKKIILPFTDKNGDACSLTDSYVEITKYDEEFIMKVNLKCGNEENYLLVYMGCYDYCTTGLCEKYASDVKTPTVYPAKPDPTPSPTPTPVPSVTPTCAYQNGNYYDKNGNIVTKEEYERQCKSQPVTPTCAYVDGKYYDKNGNVVSKEEYERQCTVQPSVDYLYEYKKTTAGYYTETDWSEWSTNPVSANTNTAVQTKTVTAKKLVGYNVKTATDTSKPIYGTKTVNTGAVETKQVCAAYDYVATGETSYGDWSYAETVYLNYSPSNSSTVQYIKVDENSWVCGDGCTAGTTKAYKKYTKSATPVTKYQCVKWETQTTPITTTVQTITGYETKVVSKEPVYETVKTTYYRYKTRTYHEGTTDLKWSVYNDTTLLNAGYVYTGNKKPLLK